MRWPFPVFHLNIRQKIVLAFALSLAGFYGIGGGAYSNLVRIGRKAEFVEIAYHFQNTILEVRRYEKNYLLYGHHEDYQQTLSYLEEAGKIFDKIAPRIQDVEGAGQIEELGQDIAHYRRLLQDVVQRRQGGKADVHDTDPVEAELRQVGKSLVDQSLQLTKAEHERIIEIVERLKTHLVGLLIVFFCLMLFITVFLTRKILKPITVIEEITLGIAAGIFKQLPVYPTHDETQAVIEAFNKMLTELEKREKQLVQAQKLSCLGILSSGIAHQLNNPLNNVSTSCQILMEDMDSADRKHIAKLLSNIDREADRARDIVKGLLDFSREREFQPDWVNLENLVVGTLRLISSQLPAGVDITYDIPEDLDLFADGQKLQEVLLNLLINAAQAMANDTGHIHISAEQYPFVTDVVDIKVRDDGVGIPAEDVPRIFDPFFSTKEAGFGTGLGLSVAYGIIEQHHGSITVESEVGKGTTFSIKLPRRGADLPENRLEDRLHEQGQDSRC
jgi:two-component system NtrC family sensor kinase